MTAVAERTAVALPIQTDGGALMKLIERVTLDKDFDVSKLKELLDVRERWEATEARKAFNAAFAAFKSEAVKIVKRTEVKDGPLKGKFHANLYDVVDATTPHLSKNGLAISWRLTKDEPLWMEVTCTLRHVAGHSESVSMGAAPDAGPGRNAIQARGSAKSYLERYTATSVLGLAAQDADDDGRAASTAAGTLMDERVLADHLAAIDSTSDADSLLSAYTKAYKAAQALKDRAAMRLIGQHKDSRKKALGL